MKRWLMAAALAAGLCGCRPVVRPGGEYEIRLSMLDSTVESQIFYVRHWREKLPGGQLQVGAEFVNLDKSQDVVAEWRAVFLDQGEREIESTEWNREVFPSGQQKAIRFNSIGAGAEDFMLMMRSSGS